MNLIISRDKQRGMDYGTLRIGDREYTACSDCRTVLKRLLLSMARKDEDRRRIMKTNQPKGI